MLQRLNPNNGIRMISRTRERERERERLRERVGGRERVLGEKGEE